MGLAWAFSVYAVHDFSLAERVVADLIVNKRIDPATARRTAQKVRESFRSAQAEKAMLSQNIQKALDGMPAGSLPAARTASPLAAYRHFEGSASKARLRVPLYNL